MILFPVSFEGFLPLVCASFVLGIFFGAVYDVFRIRRKAAAFSLKLSVFRRLDAFVIFFEDVIFSVFIAVAMILASYKLYYGFIRWYSFGGALLGFFLYRRTAGVLVMRASDRIISFIGKALAAIYRYTVRPPAFLIKRSLSSLSMRLKNKRAQKYTLLWQKNAIRGIDDALKGVRDV